MEHFGRKWGCCVPGKPPPWTALTHPFGAGPQPQDPRREWRPLGNSLQPIQVPSASLRPPLTHLISKPKPPRFFVPSSRERSSSHPSSQSRSELLGASIMLHSGARGGGRRAGPFMAWDSQAFGMLLHSPFLPNHVLGALPGLSRWAPFPEPSSSSSSSSPSPPSSPQRPVRWSGRVPQDPSCYVPSRPNSSPSPHPVLSLPEASSECNA